MTARNPRVLGLIGCAADGLESVRGSLVEPLLAQGWRVAVTATPTAAAWLRASGELTRIEAVTDLPVRYRPRLPTETSPHPPADCYAVVPATANTVAKMALGVADNQALTHVCEALGARGVPVVVFPRVNAAHVRHPAWYGHIETLRRAGVKLVYGQRVWPLHEPGSESDRELPWRTILETIRASTA